MNARVACIALSFASFGTAWWLKDYMIDNQAVWASRSDLIKVTFVAPDLIAPKTVGYAYYASALIFFVSVGLIGFVWRKKIS